jgi:HEAT repeat protein
VRGSALLLLEAADPGNPAVVTRALKLLGEPVVQYSAIEALRRRGPAAASAVPALRERLRKEANVYVRGQIVAALGAMGPAARAAVPDLVELLRDPNLVLRRNVLTALHAVGGAESAKLVPVLMEMARTELVTLRPLIFDLLGQQGPAAADAVPMLLQQLSGTDWFAHDSAARALARIAPGRARKEAVALMEKRMGEGSTQVLAARVVCLLDPGNKEGKAVLRDALRRKDEAQWVFRLQAAEGLGLLGALARDSVPLLVEALEDKRPEVRMSAALALWRLEPSRAPKSVAVLCEVLKPEYPRLVRQQAIRKLQDMGPAAREALPALRQLQVEGDSLLRQLALNAVRTIDRPAAKPGTP